MNVIYNNYTSSWLPFKTRKYIIFFPQFSVKYAIPVNKMIKISAQKKISVYDLLKLKKINGNIILAATPPLLQFIMVSKPRGLS